MYNYHSRTRHMHTLGNQIRCMWMVSVTLARQHLCKAGFWRNTWTPAESDNPASP